MATPRTRSWGLGTLVHGLPGHPLHPPLTDATIGMFVLAVGLGIVGKAGAIEHQAGSAMWLALIGGVVVAGAAAAAGVAGWVPPPGGGGGRGAPPRGPPAAGGAGAPGPPGPRG